MSLEPNRSDEDLHSSLEFMRCALLAWRRQSEGVQVRRVGTRKDEPEPATIGAWLRTAAIREKERARLLVEFDSRMFRGHSSVQLNHSVVLVQQLKKSEDRKGESVLEQSTSNPHQGNLIGCLSSNRCSSVIDFERFSCVSE